MGTPEFTDFLYRIWARTGGNESGVIDTIAASGDHITASDGGNGTVTIALSAEAEGFFDDTDMTGTEAETLTDGSDADSLHSHGTLVKILDANVTAVGNEGIGEDDLISYAMPANTLNANGKGIRVTAWGTGANNGNGKTLKAYFGTQVVASVSLTTSQANTWQIVFNVFRIGASAEKYYSSLFQDGAAEQHVLSQGTASQDTTATITIKCTGEATSDDDILQEGMIVELLP